MKSSSIFASLSVLILAACGGGGGGGDGGSPATPPPATPPAATNSAQVQLDSGVFFFGLKQTDFTTYASYISKNSNLTDAVPGTNLVAKSKYAGLAPDDMTPALFSYVPWELGSESWKTASPLPRVLYGANNTASIPLSPPDSTMPNAKWDFTITATDVSGTSIDKYLQSLPYIKQPTAIGVFGANAKLLSLTYAAADTLVASYSGAELRDSNFKPVTDMNGLLNTATCFDTGTGKSLLMRYQSNGAINLYDTSSVPPNDKCAANPVPSSLIGVANFIQKSYGPHTYLEITFPASVNLSTYKGLVPLIISPAAIDAGAKLAIVQRTTGNTNWSYGYVIPKGLQMKDPMQYMNQEAAASVKSALNLL